MPWPVSAFDYEDAYDGIFSANSLHIVSWPLVEDFFEGVGADDNAGIWEDTPVDRPQFKKKFAAQTAAALKAAEAVGS